MQVGGHRGRDQELNPSNRFPATLACLADPLVGEGPPMGPEGAGRRDTGGRAPGTGTADSSDLPAGLRPGLWAPHSRCPEDMATKVPPRGDPVDLGVGPCPPLPQRPPPHQAYVRVM